MSSRIGNGDPTRNERAVNATTGVSGLSGGRAATMARGAVIRRPWVVTVVVLVMSVLEANHAPQAQTVPSKVLETPLRTLEGHTGVVQSVAFSPDGKTLVSGGGGPEGTPPGEVGLWEVATGKFRAALKGHSRALYSVAFSADGATIVTASADESVRLWDATTCEPRAVLAGHRGMVPAAVFSPDSKYVVSGGGDGSVRLWQVETGRQIGGYRESGQWVRCVAVSRDQSLVAAGTGYLQDPGQVLVWDARTAQAKHTLSGHKQGVGSVAFSPDGKTLASGSWDRTVRLWDPQSGQTTRTLSGPADRVSSVAFSPDGRLLACGCDDGTVWLWDLASGEVKRTIRGHNHHVWSVAFSPDGNLLASGSWDRTIKFWEVKQR